MTELLTCPFCGGEARVFHFSSAIRDEVWRAVCDKPFCAQGPDGYTEAEAIAAWNTRAVETCSVVASYSPSDINEEAEWYFAFSCGHELYWDEPEPPNYCPNCGAKVVDE